MTAYDRDVNVALQRAQEEAFARGEYGFTHKMTRLYRSIGKAPPPLPPERKARTIDEAREIAAESGTCSVLDVYEIGPNPASGVAAPFTPEVLEADIGSREPTMEQVEASLGRLYERLERGDAAYVTCFEKGKPTQIYFIGMSFD